MFAKTLCVSVAACMAFPIAARAQADTTAAPQSHMAPMAQYLMPRDSEIAFARTAAPSAVSHNAKILVLTAHGYETAVPGTNGFVCLVTRSWDLAATRPSATFWNPMIRVAQCFNAQGAQTIIPVYLMKTEWALAGASEAEIGTREQAAWADGTLKAGAAPGAMGYMLSNRSWGVGASPGPWRPHLMFYYPTVQAPNWGADLDGSPIASSSTSGSAGTSVYFVLVPAWSDGSLAPALPPARTASSAGQ